MNPQKQAKQRLLCPKPSKAIYCNPERLGVLLGVFWRIPYATNRDADWSTPIIESMI